MDFAARREVAIAATYELLREPLKPDRVLVHAWRFAEGHPKALERWLFEIFPDHHPEDARKLVMKKGIKAWDEEGKGSSMDDEGWKAFQQACRGKIPNLDKLAEHAAKNMHALLGPDTAAEILHAAGGMQQLSRMTQRDCAHLGNESGMFGGKQKLGILQCHELATSDRALRVLASRVVLAARLDTYHGHFKGEALRQEVLYAQ